ncbi:MAG: hypothetical protein ACT4NY_17325 [Pseudonocardiales bacterium]
MLHLVITGKCQRGSGEPETPATSVATGQVRDFIQEAPSMTAEPAPGTPERGPMTSPDAAVSIPGPEEAEAIYRRWGWPVMLRGEQVWLALESEAMALLIPVALATDLWAWTPAKPSIGRNFTPHVGHLFTAGQHHSPGKPPLESFPVGWSPLPLYRPLGHLCERHERNAGGHASQFRQQPRRYVLLEAQRRYIGIQHDVFRTRY